MKQPHPDSWHHVVEGYLGALHDDARSDREAKLSNSQSRFLHEFATKSVQREYLRDAEARLGSLSPPPDRSCWQVVRDAEDRVLVEITIGPNVVFPNQAPFVATRLLLVFQNGDWLIDGVFRACIRCNNGSGIAGQCFFCEGTGDSILPDGERCDQCGGTGRCSGCVEEDVPGWCRVPDRPPTRLGRRAEPPSARFKRRWRW